MNRSTSWGSVCVNPYYCKIYIDYSRLLTSPPTISSSPMWMLSMVGCWSLDRFDSYCELLLVSLGFLFDEWFEFVWTLLVSTRDIARWWLRSVWLMLFAPFRDYDFFYDCFFEDLDVKVPVVFLWFVSTLVYGSFEARFGISEDLSKPRL